ncbi:MAG: T9SS type B sorting domain-containing protein [Bacteroidetes bacterium]|nr:MAG: T9SS type B sorting domain-containing protein [Bacteroidota bacterium]
MKKPLALLLCFACFNLFSTVASSQSFGSNNPVTCNGNDGYITIGGLVAGATYSVSYSDDGAAVGPLSLTANISGQVIISGLNAGLYSNFSLVYNGSTTNLSIGIVLSNPIFIPTFTSIPPICAGSAPPALPTTSNNGMTGTWNPGVINNTTSGSYTFTPTGGQCGIPITIPVTIIPRTTPTFSFGTSLNICGGGAVPTLPNTSTNGISGTWNPAVVDAQNSGTYTFTPNAGQCANPAAFNVTVSPNITPSFSFGLSLTICAGGTVPTLPTTSTNAITGTWSPSTVDAQNSGVYTFTPAAGQCALPAAFAVTVNPNLTPTFSFGTSINLCAGGTVPTLPTTSTNGITGSWSPTVVSSTTPATYTFTPTAGQCAVPATLNVTLTPNITPSFTFGTSLIICAGGTVPTLPTTSNNGITGVRSPSVVSNTTSGTYTFTPGAGQCAVPATFSVTVNPIITPSFNINTYSICAGSTPPVLPTTSLEGITGTWSPTTVDNQNYGVYTFTPNPGQCAVTTTAEVYVMPNVAPTFNFGTSLTICGGGTVPVLPNYSNEGLTGTWSPAVVSTTNSGVYTFTADAGQCAVPATFTVTVNPVITPAFSFGSSLTICNGGVVPTLPTTSSNAITGSWSPTIVSNTSSGVYTFTPNPGQCAASATFTVTVNPILTPAFSFGTSITICAGNAVPTLPTTSTNGVVGVWSPSTVDNQNSGTYTFTPNAGQCAITASFSVTVNPNVTPTFSIGSALSICTGGSVPVLPTVSNNGINGTWNPAVVSSQTSGTYTFTPATGQGPCIATVVYTVTVNPIVTPAFNFGNLSICIGASLPVLPATSQNGISGTWSPAVIDNQNSGSYTFTPNAGQCANPLTINVTVNSVPTVVVRADTTLNDGDMMPATFFAGTPAGINYKWTNSNPNIGLTEFGVNSVPSFIALNKGNDPIVANISVVPLNGGCEGTARNYKITVKPLDKDVFVPNVFSPNGDGKNDKLFAYGNYVDKLEMRIFNQWGEQIILINSLNQGWDGTHRGKPQPVGVYVYVLKAIMTDGRTINMKGSITLLR